MCQTKVWLCLSLSVCPYCQGINGIGINQRSTMRWLCDPRKHRSQALELCGGELDGRQMYPKIQSVRYVLVVALKGRHCFVLRWVPWNHDLCVVGAFRKPLSTRRGAYLYHVDSSNPNYSRQTLSFVNMLYIPVDGNLSSKKFVHNLTSIIYCFVLSLAFISHEYIDFKVVHYQSLTTYSTHSSDRN